MSELDFFKPQRQSLIGIGLIFSTAVFQLVRNFWVLAVYFLVRDIDREVMLLSLFGLMLLLILTLIYSIFSYLRFRFYIDEDKGEFVLEKGVFSSQVVSIPYNKIQQVNYKRNILQRLLGVYSIAIDTAGSKDKEVEIKALSKVQADRLGETLMELAAREKEEIKSEEANPESAGANEHQVLWEHNLSFSTLLKLGLTSNYLRGLAILLTFYFSLKEQFQYSENTDFMPEIQIMEVVSTGIFILLLILVGMLITLGETFIKYYNLSLRRFPKGLQVEMGLRENTKVTLRAERVQLLQLLTNPLQRKLDLFKLKISLASSQDDVKKDRIQIPGLPQEIVQKVLDYLYLNEITEKQLLRPHRLGLFRSISQGMLPVWIGVVAILFNLFYVNLGWVLTGGILYIILMAGFQLMYFRSLKLAVSENFLIKHSGVWIKKKQYVEMYKLQSVSLSEPIWYKKRQLVNLTFHTAGGDVAFNFIKKAEAVPLMDYLLYKIEATNKKWM